MASCYGLYTMKSLRVVLFTLAVTVNVISCSSLTGAERASTQLEWVGEASLPHATFFEKTQVGGLSGVYFDSKTQELVAVSDDPGMESSRGAGRYYHFGIDMTKNGVNVVPKRLTFLNGFRVGATDLEALAPLDGGWLMSLESETDKMNMYKEGNLSSISRPRLLKVNASGQVTNEFLLPERFQPTTRLDRGVALNLGVESVTNISDAFLNSQWAMMPEGPLIQDQERFPLFLRLTLFSLEAASLKNTQSNEQWQDRVEYLYPMSPVVKDLGFEPDVIDRGVSDILYVGEGRFWVLERSYYFNKTKNLARNIIEIYEVTLKESSATPTNATSRLDNSSVPLRKRLVANLDDFISDMQNPTTPVGHILDNVEGMTFGPKLDGHNTLILVTDDNFRATQRTIFRVFKVISKIGF